MKNLFDIKGKVVVLTGGCGILGRNIAHYLVEQGAKVVVLDRIEDQGWRENIGRGDILLAVEGKRLNSLAELASILREKRSGQMLTADFAALDMARRYVRYKARLILK